MYHLHIWDYVRYVWILYWYLIELNILHVYKCVLYIDVSSIISLLYVFYIYIFLYKIISELYLLKWTYLYILILTHKIKIAFYIWLDHSLIPWLGWYPSWVTHENQISSQCINCFFSGSIGPNPRHTVFKAQKINRCCHLWNPNKHTAQPKVDGNSTHEWDGKYQIVIILTGSKGQSSWTI